MLDHISLPVSDLDSSAVFYDGVLNVLGYHRIKETRIGIGYGDQSDKAPRFWILRKTPDNSAQPGLGLHISFAANSPAMVDAFHATALNLGGSDAGRPGPRPEYTQPFYGAFVFDLEGFKLEAVCRE